MTVDLVYVHVARPEAAAEFNEAARKFIASYKEFPPEHEHKLFVVFCNGDPTLEMTAIYDGLDCAHRSYNGSGMDVGAQQAASRTTNGEFIASVNSRVFFHRAGWLKRMMEAREENGPGIYGSMASFEGCPLGQVWPNPHLRTAFYGLDSKLWLEFPHTVNSREDSFRFESGEWNIANWCEANGHKAMLVSWGGCWHRGDWRKVPHGFRSGDQSNCLVWDRHSTIFNDNPGAHAHLEGLANGTP